MCEQWKPCPGYERTHSVSDMGRLVRKPRRAGDKPRMLSCGSRSKAEGDYVRVCLPDETGDRYKTTYLHILVAKAFVPNPRNMTEVNHINGNKRDNRAENLEWVTHRENMEHASHVLGALRGPRAALRRLADEDIRVIRASSKTQRELATEYSVSQATISHIRRRKIYKEVQ